MVYFANQPEEDEESQRRGRQYVNTTIDRHSPVQFRDYDLMPRTVYVKKQIFIEAPSYDRHDPRDLGYTVEKTSRPYKEDNQAGGSSLGGGSSSVMYV